MTSEEVAKSEKKAKDLNDKYDKVIGSITV